MRGLVYRERRDADAFGKFNFLSFKGEELELTKEKGCDGMMEFEVRQE